MNQQEWEKTNRDYNKYIRDIRRVNFWKMIRKESIDCVAFCIVAAYLIYVFFLLLH